MTKREMVERYKRISLEVLEGATFDKVAQDHGISRERVRQIVSRALELCNRWSLSSTKCDKGFPLKKVNMRLVRRTACLLKGAVVRLEAEDYYRDPDGEIFWPRPKQDHSHLHLYRRKPHETHPQP